ncbi:MAG: sulfatase family protein, partial [Planctomycetota bacterium]
SQRKRGQPFFAQVNFPLTHRTFVRDKKNPIDPEKVKLPPYYPDHPVSRRDWADYLESIQVLDTQIGEVLKRLEDEGLADNTIVFYFGDHGRPHVRGKQWLYEGGIHIPLIIRWPGHIKAGAVADDLVSSIDFGPTSMSLAGIKPPQHMQGQVFLGSQARQRKYIFAARDRCDETGCDETVDRIRCVRTKRFKYIRNFMPDRPYTQFNCYKNGYYPVVTLMEVLHKQGKLTPAQEKFMAQTRPKEELYDLKKDPFEINNLAGKPKYAKILNEFRDRLADWIEETSDNGEIPEDKQEVKYWKDFFGDRHKNGMKKKGLSSASPEEYLKWWERKLLK